MPEQFLHGAEVVEITDGARPISTVSASVIGLVGIAPDADALLFPLNTPVLVTSKAEAAKLLPAGTLMSSIDGIYDQTGAVVVVVRVEEGADDAATQSNIIGGVNGTTGEYEGLEALTAAESKIGAEPRIVIAPGYSQIMAVATTMLTVAESLKAVAILDGPNTTDADAKTYAGNFGDRRAYTIDPWVTVWDTNTDAEVSEPPSARAAGMLAKSDNDRGFWWSPSNTIMKGITGTTRSVPFKLGDTTCRANLLNADNITTIINQNGFRLWGNRTLSTDPVWAFLNVVRTNDMINDSIQRAHLWAVDRNITKTYLEDVAEGVNNYLRHLTSIGAILGGTCWADPDLNTPSQLQQGKVYFDYDFTPPAPAEHITFRSHLVSDYFANIFK